MYKKYNTSAEALKEHLTEMMERLLDPELVATKESAQIEIEKARALKGLVDSVIDMRQAEVKEKEVMVEALKVAADFNYSWQDLERIGLEVHNGDKS